MGSLCDQKLPWLCASYRSCTRHHQCLCFEYGAEGLCEGDITCTLAKSCGWDEYQKYMFKSGSKSSLCFGIGHRTIARSPICLSTVSWLKKVWFKNALYGTETVYRKQSPDCLERYRSSRLTLEDRYWYRWEHWPEWDNLYKWILLYDEHKSNEIHRHLEMLLLLLVDSGTIYRMIAADFLAGQKLGMYPATKYSVQ